MIGSPFTVTAATKRSPAPVGGVKTAPVTHLATLAVLPLMPVSPEVVERYRLQSPRKTFVTGTPGNPDVLEGDVLSVGGADYAVKVVARWTAPVAYLKLIVEQVV
jgi:hypothetical protein